MMSTEKLAARLDKADAVADNAAETAARAHEDAPGTALEADALDDLVLARRERDMLQHHLDVAMAHEAGLPMDGSTTGGTR